MPTSRKKPKSFTLTLDEETKQRLEKLAFECGVSQADVCRAIIGMEWKRLQGDTPSYDRAAPGVENPHAEGDFFAHVKDPRHVLFEATLCRGRGQVVAGRQQTGPKDVVPLTTVDAEKIERLRAFLKDLP